MDSTTMKGQSGLKQSVLNWFGKVWTKLMGRPEADATAFETLLKSYDNYLTGGLLRRTYNGSDFIRDSLVREQGVRPEALASRMNTVDRTFTKGDLYNSIYGFEREGQGGMLPTTMSVGPIDQPLRTALVSGSSGDVFRGVMSLLPDQLPVHQDLFYRMQQDVKLAQDLVKQIKDGKIKGDIPKGVEEKLKMASSKLGAMRRALQKQGLAMERQADLANFTYEGLEDTVARTLVTPDLPDPESPPPEMEQGQALMGLRKMSPRTLAEVKGETSKAELEGQTEISWLARQFGLTQFMKKTHPEVRPIVDAVQDEHGKATQTALELNVTLNGRADPEGVVHVDPVIRKQLERVAGSKALTSAFSDAVRLTAERAKANVTWSWKDPEFQAILKPFNPTDREALKSMQTQYRLRHEHFVEKVVPEKFGEINMNNTGRVIASLENGMLPEQARGLSGQLYQALQSMQDPQQAPMGAQMLQAVAAQMRPATFLTALRHANQSIMDVNGFLEIARKNPDFVSEQRFDAHHMRMTGPDGQKHYSSAKTKEELNARRKSLESRGYTFNYYTPKADAQSPAGGINPEMLQKFQEMDTLAAQRITEALSGRPDSAEILARVLPDVQRANEYSASAQAFKPVPGLTRNLVEGREFLNMIDNAQEFYNRGINWFKYQAIKARTGLDALHPEVQGNRVLKDWTEQHVKNYLTPDNQIARKFTEAVFYQRLALNFGNSFLEGIQSLGTGMQALIAETGSVSDAYSRTGSAMKEWLYQLKNKKASTPALEWLRRKAEATGMFEPTLWDDLYDPDRNAMLSISGKLGGPVKRGTDFLKNMARKFSTGPQKMNNNISGIAAFKIGVEEKGMSWEEAFNFARDVKERGTGTGGKPQRSVGLWSIKSRPVPQLMNSLQSYVTLWFNQMASDYAIGFRGAGKEITPQQRLGSKKAFVYGLAAQAVLAGGLGLPGVGQGIALMNQATGLDLKGWLRQNLSRLFDEDQDSGGLLTNLALRGGLASVTPIDPSNRAAIAVPFVGVDPYKGFSLAALAGAPGSSVSDFVQGMMALARGDWVGYQKMLPSVLKGPAQIVQGGGIGNLFDSNPGAVRDVRGGLLQTLSPAEKWLTALGLPSSRIQRSRDTAEALKRQEDAIQHQRESQVDELAKLVRTGNTQEVQRRMIELRKADPTLDIRALGRSIAQRVVAQSVPYESRHNVNPAADLAGLSSRAPATEALRRQTSYQVQSSLSLRPHFDPRADLEAAQVDALLNSNPYLTRDAAFREARGTRQVRRPFVPQWMQDSQ